MKIKFLSILFLISINIQSTEILCSGSGNRGELIEIQINYSEADNQISIENMIYPLQTNNKFSMVWQNTSDGTIFTNYLSKLNGAMQVISDPPGEEPSIRANLLCVDAKKTLF